MSIRCSQGHDSDDPEYCSTCGAKITGLPRSIPDAAARKAGGGSAIACPDCGEPRTLEAHYCEVCRFDFTTNAPNLGVGAALRGAGAARTAEGPIASVVASAVSPVTSAAFVSPPAPSHPVPTISGGWELELLVDASLDVEPAADSPAPKGVRPVIVPVAHPEILVGRHDPGHDIHPLLPVYDPGASRRHLKFLLGGDRSLTLVDLASSNGTRLNGRDVPSGGRVALQSGDTITLGRWSRIIVRCLP